MSRPGSMKGPPVKMMNRSDEVKRARLPAEEDACRNHVGGFLRADQCIIVG